MKPPFFIVSPVSKVSIFHNFPEPPVAGYLINHPYPSFPSKASQIPCVKLVAPVLLLRKVSM